MPQRQETKTTALMWAIADGNQAAAKMLIEAHADVRASSAKGITPLLYAATTGNVEMAKILLAAGVNPNRKPARTAPMLCRFRS